MKIPKDIVEAINRHQSNEEIRKELFEHCLTIYALNINVGHAQLIRCMLKLSDFDSKQFLKIIESQFYGDPRDVIMEAQKLYAEIDYGRRAFE